LKLRGDGKDPRAPQPAKKAGARSTGGARKTAARSAGTEAPAAKAARTAGRKK
jgi:hypothetical protein